MGGDCAEAFDEFSVDHVRDTFRVILQMSLVMTFGSGLPIIKVGRMAGQFAKPRSDPEETRDGVSLPSYRGDIINSEDFSEASRKNDPMKMVQAYHQSSQVRTERTERRAPWHRSFHFLCVSFPYVKPNPNLFPQTLNILRAFATGGYADISRLHAWNLEFTDKTSEASRYRKLTTKVDESLRFMKAIGVDTSKSEFTSTDFYTAHECLLLPYEEALTRQDSTTGRWYDCSAHMLWVGERTRQSDGAHFEFVRGIGNPLGVKISDKCTPDQLIEICDQMNPNNIPGRLTIIVRMGAEKLKQNLPGLIRAVQREGKSVLWISDPVHGNTYKAKSGFKTRSFDRIRAELKAFFDVHEQMGSHPGGMHLEMTGEDVTECVGGLQSLMEEDLSLRYHTQCDPRLNGVQALQLAFLVAERMRESMGLPPLE